MFEWVDSATFFLFDFDGLLVNTESLHYEAYRQTCESFGGVIEWDFMTYCGYAHTSSAVLRSAILEACPSLEKIGWAKIYERKQRVYESKLRSGQITLMPGVRELLQVLESRGKKRCVVTNSRRVQIELILEKLPELRSIPLWITREDYKEPKPSPDGYFKALETMGEAGDVCIGFEDSLKGIEALKRTSIRPILVCPEDQMPKGIKLPEGILRFHTLLEIENLG